MDPTIIHGLSFAYSDYPIVKYKLKHQIDIDALKPLEFFEYNRSYKVNGMDKTDVLQCKVKGIRNNYSNLQNSTKAKNGSLGNKETMLIKASGSEH